MILCISIGAGALARLPFMSCWTWRRGEQKKIEKRKIIHELYDAWSAYAHTEMHASFVFTCVCAVFLSRMILFSMECLVVIVNLLLFLRTFNLYRNHIASFMTDRPKDMCIHGVRLRQMMAYDSIQMAAQWVWWERLQNWRQRRTTTTKRRLTIWYSKPMSTIDEVY